MFIFFSLTLPIRTGNPFFFMFEEGIYCGFRIECGMTERGVQNDKKGEGLVSSVLSLNIIL